MAVLEWISCLKRELAEPDLWAALKDVSAFKQAAPSDAGSQPLAGEELNRFLAVLEEVRKAAPQHAAGQQDLKALMGALDRIEEATKRTWKGDLWSHIVGCVVSLIISGLLATETGKWAINELGQAASWLVLAGASAVKSLP